MNPDNPMIVQSDRTILLEVDHPQHAEARDALAQFAELEKSPEHIHTYRLSPLSLWNAAAGGMNAQEILDLLTRYSKYAIPTSARIFASTSIAMAASNWCATATRCCSNQRIRRLSLR